LKTPQVDIKHIDDIPEFYPFYKTLNLPRYQMTARDVRNSYKGRQTPKDIIQEYNLPIEILVLSPVVIDDILYKKQKIKSFFKLRNDYSKDKDNVYHHVSVFPVFSRLPLFNRVWRNI